MRPPALSRPRGARSVMLALHVLASGSKGNAAVVEDISSHRTVLIDCGICKRDVLARCNEAGVDPAHLDAILVTHDHTDHTKGLGVLTRGLKASTPPIYALDAVRDGCADLRALADTCDVRSLALDEVLGFGGLSVVPFRTSHDASASCGFRFESADGDSLGFMTDTGIVTGEAHEALQNVRILALESNHDVRMLEEGPYPYQLKKRVASDRGHLSNVQAADELAALLSTRLETVVAMHLSEHNNLPSLATRALEGVVAQQGHGARVLCASQRMLVSVD